MNDRRDSGTSSRPWRPPLGNRNDGFGAESAIRSRHDFGGLWLGCARTTIANGLARNDFLDHPVKFLVFVLAHWVSFRERILLEHHIKYNLLSVKSKYMFNVWVI